MSRYTCYKCKSEHGEDNMVAYCAACFADRRPTPPSPSAESQEVEAALRRAMTKGCFPDCTNGALHCGCGERALYILAAEVRRLGSEQAALAGDISKRPSWLEWKQRAMAAESEVRRLRVEIAEAMEASLAPWHPRPIPDTIKNVIDGLMCNAAGRLDAVDRADKAEDEARRLRESREAERAALEAAVDLVNRLDVVHHDRDYIAVWETAQAHLGQYKGRQYTKEHEALRLAIIALTPAPRKETT